MKKLGVNGRKWLKCFHLLFACLWVAGAVSLQSMSWTLEASGGGELYGMLRAMKFIDDFIIIPGATGCLLTGLVYSVWTNWGFFRHHWITVKWVINIGGVIFGTFWLGPWLNSTVPMAAELGLDALADPQYQHSRMMNMNWGLLQTATIVFALFVSVLKPWGRRKADAGRGKS